MLSIKKYLTFHYAIVALKIIKSGMSKVGCVCQHLLDKLEKKSQKIFSFSLDTFSCKFLIFIILLIKNCVDLKIKY